MKTLFIVLVSLSLLSCGLLDDNEEYILQKKAEVEAVLLTGVDVISTGSDILIDTGSIIQ